MVKINATKRIYEEEKMRVIKNLLAKKIEIDGKKEDSLNRLDSKRESLRK